MTIESGPYRCDALKVSSNPSSSSKAGTVVEAPMSNRTTFEGWACKTSSSSSGCLLDSSVSHI